MPQSLAASPREYPSSSNASPNIRRAALAALLQAAACRKPAAVRSARLIVTAFGIEVSANHGQPAENHTALVCKHQLSQRSIPLVLLMLDSPMRSINLHVSPSVETESSCQAPISAPMERGSDAHQVESPRRTTLAAAIDKDGLAGYMAVRLTGEPYEQLSGRKRLVRPAERHRAACLDGALLLGIRRAATAAQSSLGLARWYSTGSLNRPIRG
jgi:hypothetical protein